MVVGTPITKTVAGPPGPVTNLEIGTVTTVSAGQPATATIGGTAPNKTLNLGIPAGGTAAVGAALTSLTITNPPAAVNTINFEEASDSEILSFLLTAFTNLRGLT